MMGKGNPDIHKYGFGANPQNINRKGPPRKSFASINATLMEKGVSKLTKQDLIDAYALIFNSTEEDLQEILEAEDTPMAFKIIVKSLGDKKFRDQAMKDLRDYMFGKSAQQVEVTFKEQPLFPDIGPGKLPAAQNRELPRVMDADWEEVREDSAAKHEKKL